jgi:hypothetical protein
VRRLAHSRSARGAGVGALSIAAGNDPHAKAPKAGEVPSGKFALEFKDVSPVNRAFASAARERRFDVSEMTITTVMQAIAFSASRQPTFVGQRFEGAHVEAYVDPPFGQRVDAGLDLLTMLRAGELDEAIVGNDVPDDPSLRLLSRDPIAAGEAFFARHGFVPINHMVVVKRELAQEASVAFELCRMFAASKARAPVPADVRGRAPIGRVAVTPSARLAADVAFEQGLLPRTRFGEIRQRIGHKRGFFRRRPREE